MTEFEIALDQLRESLGVYLPNLVGALFILVIGWLIALAVAAAIQGLLRATRLDDRIAALLVGEEKVKALNVERLVAKIVFYFLIIFVLVAFFETLGFQMVAESLNQVFITIFDYIPRLMGAGLLLMVAWLIAAISKLAVMRVLSTAKIDQKLESKAGLEEKKELSLTATLGDAVYWIVFLLFLPAVLDALAIKGLLEPVQAMTNQVLTFLPNIFAAGLVLLVGWFAARILQRIVSNLLASVGINRLSESVGLTPLLGTQQLSGIAGLVVYTLVFIPVLIAALNALALDALTEPASNMLNTVLGAVPAIFAAALVLGLTYMVGRVASGLVTNLLSHIGFDAAIAKLGVGNGAGKGKGKQAPSAIVGYLALVAIMLFALIEAFGLLGFELLADLTAQFMRFSAHIIFGLVLLAVSLYVANAVGNALRTSGIHQARLLAAVSRVAVLLLGGAMALRQMGVANEIIILAFGLTLGSVAVAVALAVGLGGREVATRQLEEWVREMKKSRGR